MIGTTKSAVEICLVVSVIMSEHEMEVWTYYQPTNAGPSSQPSYIHYFSGTVSWHTTLETRMEESQSQPDFSGVDLNMTVAEIAVTLGIIRPQTLTNLEATPVLSVRHRDVLDGKMNGSWLKMSDLSEEW